MYNLSNCTYKSILPSTNFDICVFFFIIDGQYPEIEDNLTDGDFVQYNKEERQEEEVVKKKKTAKKKETTIASSKSKLIHILEIVNISIENYLIFGILTSISTLI